MIRPMALLAALFLPAVAFAEAPTTWNFSNEAKTAVVVSCKSLRLTGISSAVTFDTPPVAVGKVHTHKWSNHYNDGMGLNAGDWLCVVKDQRQSNWSHSAQMEFKTDWGQTVNLFVGEKKGSLTLHKEPSGKTYARP